VAVAIEYQKTGREGVARIEFPDPGDAGVVVALARQPGPGFEHEHAEAALVAEERDVGGEVQTFREDLDLVAFRHDDVFPVAGIEEGPLLGAYRIECICHDRRRRERNAGKHEHR
jgi:hypothetical protein